jgi:SEC-C motif
VNLYGAARTARRFLTFYAADRCGHHRLHYLCPSYKAFFGHIRPAMTAMCDLLRVDRAPSELMRRYAAADARRGRNDACPCGSGRKWKRCHQLTPGTAQH